MTDILENLARMDDRFMKFLEVQAKLLDVLQEHEKEKSFPGKS